MLFNSTHADLDVLSRRESWSSVQDDKRFRYRESVCPRPLTDIWAFVVGKMRMVDSCRKRRKAFARSSPAVMPVVRPLSSLETADLSRCSAGLLELPLIRGGDQLHLPFVTENSQCCNRAGFMLFVCEVLVFGMLPKQY